jgi:hypothetical protein
MKNYQCPHLVWAARGRKSPSRFDFKRFKRNRHRKYRCPIVEDYDNECRNIPKVEDPSKVYDAS